MKFLFCKNMSLTVFLDCVTELEVQNPQLLRIQLFWHVILYHWVSVLQYTEGLQCHQLTALRGPRGMDHSQTCQLLKMKESVPFLKFWKTLTKQHRMTSRRHEFSTQKPVEISNLALQNLLYMALPYQDTFCKTFFNISASKNVISKHCEEISYIQKYI